MQKRNNFPKTSGSNVGPRRDKGKAEMDKDGKDSDGKKALEDVRLSIGDLSRIRLNRIPGLESVDGYVCIVFYASGVTEVGISKERPDLSPIDDIKRLTGASNLANPVEGKGKGQKGKALVQPDPEQNSASALAQMRIESKIEDYIVPKSFAKEFANHKRFAENLLLNKSQIENNVFKTPDGTLTKQFLISQIQECLKIVETQMETRGRPSATPIEEVLLLNGVSQWTWNTLTSAGLGVGTNHNLSRILFPANPVNGLKMTVRELRNKRVLETHFNILANSQAIVGMVNENRLLAQMASLDDIRLDDNTQKEVRSILSHEFQIIPIMDTEVYLKHFSPANSVILQEKMGIEFPLLRSFNMYLWRIYTIYTGTDSNTILAVTEAVYGQKAAPDKPRQVLMDLFKNKTLDMPKLLVVEKVLQFWKIEGMPPTVGNFFEKHVSLIQNQNGQTVVKLDTVIRPYWLIPGVTVQEAAALKAKAPIAVPKSGNKEQGKRQKPIVHSSLTDHSIRLINNVAKENIPHARRIQEYLQSFYDLNIQNIAAKLIAANIQALGETIYLSEHSVAMPKKAPRKEKLILALEQPDDSDDDGTDDND